MSATSFVPLQAIQAWYDTDPGVVPVRVFLLDATVTSMLDSYELAEDLPGLLATTGPYNATTGIDAGEWPLYYDVASKVLELSLPGPGWDSSANYDVTFRWVALAMPGGNLLTVIDFGVAQTLTSDPLRLAATESTYIPNSYPVLRWRKA